MDSLKPNLSEPVIAHLPSDNADSAKDDELEDDPALALGSHFSAPVILVVDDVQEPLQARAPRFCGNRTWELEDGNPNATIEATAFYSKEYYDIYTSLNIHDKDRGKTITNYFTAYNRPALGHGECGTTLNLFQTQRGSGKNGTYTLTDNIFMEECAKNVTLAVISSYCKERWGLNKNVTLTAPECELNDRHGEATLRFDNIMGNGRPPDIINLNESDGVYKQPYGNSLLPATFLLWAQGDKPKFDFINSTTEASILSGHPVLTRALEAYYSKLAVQLFRSSFVPSNGTISGTIDGQISRLTVHLLSYSILVALLSIMSTTCADLMLLSASDEWRLAMDPSTLAGPITLLASHPRISDILQDSKLLLRVSGSSDGQKPRWWNPWGTTKSTRLATAGNTASMIAVLQVTLVVSSRNHGIVLVDIEITGSTTLGLLYQLLSFSPLG
ncbi:hypothetical protein B0H63DRAFT_559914 [Podospora didyma]|uniref:Uncharacterized protein n=1 Tax=Podospora didyma TaxID=330526 RepID=A0AAE0TZK7_9PEZI|nr:hypothetical protein B0H63DRAFT_559914 [Podospora didyma]